jgi:SAM-dependent methyltransferase
VQGKTKKMVRSLVKKCGYEIVRFNTPVSHFHSNRYLRLNSRRLEHLASLRILVAGMSVLEVGAGIGDHSHYYIDRGCKMTITEARFENLQYLRNRYPACNVQFLDMEHPSNIDGSPFDVVHCYGLLHHLGNPEQALKSISWNTVRIMFLETRVSFGESEERNIVREPQSDPTQAYSGIGCRPTRPWLFNQLQGLFEYVYLPKTQPNHEEFPVDWSKPDKHQADSQSAIFIATRDRIENELLTQSLINKQARHE